MLVRDKKYPNRVLVNYKGSGRDIIFNDHIVDVDPKTGIELITQPDFESADPITSPQAASHGLFPFNYDSWVKDKKIILDTAIGYNNGYGKSGIMMAEALGDLCDTYVINNKWIGSSPLHISDKLNILVNKTLHSLDSWYIQYWPVFSFAPRAKRQVGYTMLEATRWPESWRSKVQESCERLIVPSVAQKQAAIDSGIKMDIEVIPLGVDPEMFPLVKRIRHEDDKALIFGMEGTLTYRKGIDVAIKAFKLAFPGNENVSFYIKTTEQAGASFYYQDIKNDPRFIFNSEWLSPEMLVSEFYGKIDCYVFPSRGEGFGLTTVQAMMTGLPVIASNCGGIQDQITDNQTGYLADTDIIDVPNKLPDGDWNPFGYGPTLSAENQQWWEPRVESVAEKMRDVYEDRQKANRIAKAGRTNAMKYFTAKTQAKNIINYLNKKI